jgi:hypothetical protein
MKEWALISELTIPAWRVKKGNSDLKPVCATKPIASKSRAVVWRKIKQL